MGQKVLPIALLLLGLYSFSVIAQVCPDTVNLEEITISGKKPLISVSSLPLQEINATFLKQTGSQNLAHALRHFTGINLKDYGGIGGLKTVNLRSLGAQHVAVFADNIPITESASGQIDLGRLSLLNMDRITLSSGGPEDIFRPARWFATASAVSMYSAVPVSSTPEWSGGIQLGSAGLWKPNLQFALRKNENTFWQSSVQYTRATGTYRYRVRNGTQEPQWHYRQNSDLENIDLQNQLRLGNTNLKADWHLLYNYSNRGLPGAVILYNPYSRQRLTNNDLNQAITLSGYKAGIHWQTLLKHFLSEMIYSDPDFLNSQQGLKHTYRQQEYYFSQLVGGNHAGIQWSSAIDWMFNFLHASHFITQPERFGMYLSQAAQWNNSRWEISLHSLTQWWKEPPVTKTDKSQHFAWSPGFSLARRMNPDGLSRMRFSFKKAYRLPTFNEMYYNLVGNNQLRPERALLFNFGWISGWEFNQHQLSVSADVFFNHLNDKILAVPTKNLFVWSMQNIGKVTTGGLESTLRFRGVFLGHLQVYSQLNYTFQYAVDRTSRQLPSYNHQIPYIPRHNLNAFLDCSFQHWSGGLSFFYQSQRFVLPENRPENQLSPWATLDLHGSYQAKLLGYPANILFRLENMFNQQYEVIRNFPMPGRSFTVTLTFHSKTH